MKLFGPVFFYDLIRMGRQGRYVALRCVYAFLLLFLLYFVYRSFASTALAMGSRLSAQDLANFGEAFFGYYLVTQYVVLLLITPAYVAGAIAEEKQRRTLEYIFATDLRNREIVLGKLAARLVNLFLFLLAGLPVISFAQLFGGISPELLWCGFGATLVTVLSLTSISLLLSVYAKRVRDALVMAYLVPVGYLILWGFLEGFRGFMTLDPPAPPWVLEWMGQVLWLYKSGNPFVGIYDLVMHVRSTGSLGNQPYWLLLRYSVFHLLVTIACLALAIALIRRIYTRQAFGSTRQARAMHAVARRLPDAKAGAKGEGVHSARRGRRHPPVGSEPMLWKELWVERGLRMGVIGQSLFTLLTLACLSPVLIGAGVYLLDTLRGSGGLGEGTASGMNMYIRIIGTFLTALLLLGVGLRAANSIGSERDRQTLEGILASPLSLEQILFAKWLGSITGMRWMSVIVAFVWFLGLVSAGLHPLALLLLLVEVLAFAAFAACLGLVLSISARTTLRAVIGTTLVLLILGLGPWIVSSAVTTQNGLPESGLRAVSPLFVIEYSAFHYKDVEHMREYRRYSGYSSRDPFDPEGYNQLTWVQLIALAVSILMYTVSAMILWGLAVELFRQRCGRTLQRSQSPRLPLPVEPRVTVRE